MSGRLQGKKAFITGAAKGIGRACAIAFAREGATVHATDLDVAALQDLMEHGDIQVTGLDVRNTREVEMIAAAQDVDILLNVAGIVHTGNALECSDEDWDLSFDVNLKGMHRTIRAFLPGMIDRGGGSIINVASAHGVFKASPKRYVYSATKAGVAALTRSVAADFIGEAVRCNCICPGGVVTPSLLERIDAAGSGAMEKLLQTQPLGRFGTAEEIAMLAVYLASDESSFTTGSVHLIDGGFTL